MSNLGGIGTLELARRRPDERRSHKRKSVLSELGKLVVIRLGPERGLLLNLSAGGLSVQVQNRLTAAISLSVQFLPPRTKACVNPTCEVVWVNDKCEVGLRFLQLAESERLAIEDWLASHGAEPGDVLAGAAPSARDDPPASPDSAAPEDLLPQVVSQALWLTNADGAALVLRSEEGIVCRASTGSAPAVGARLRPNSGLSGECFRLGQVVRCDDAENDSRVNAAVTQRLQSRAILIAPIQVEGSTRGVLQVLSSRPFAFHAGHTAILVYLAGLVGSSLAAEEEALRLDSLPVVALAEPEPDSRRNVFPYGAVCRRLGLLTASHLAFPEVFREPGGSTYLLGRSLALALVALGNGLLLAFFVVRLLPKFLLPVVSSLMRFRYFHVASESLVSFELPMILVLAACLILAGIILDLAFSS